jgi:HAMP domain-containing protein
MASNLTAQVRSIAQVARAVERGDLSQQITVEAKGTANGSTLSPRSPRPLTAPLVRSYVIFL